MSYKICIDPSMISGKPNNSKCELVISIVLAGYENEVDIPNFTDLDDFRNKMYPWNWKLPEFITLITYNDALDKKNEYRLNLQFVSKSYDDDKEKLKLFIEDEIESALEIKGGNISAITKSSLLIEGGNFDFHDITGPASGEEVEKYIIRKNIENLICKKITLYSSRISPLNQNLKLVFIAESENLKFNSDETNFVAFPNSSNLANVWALDTPILPNKTQYPIDGFELIYKNLNKVFCPLTEFPKPDIRNISDFENEGIMLRDDEGAFFGRTKIEVHDIDKMGEIKEWIKETIKSQPDLFDFKFHLLEFLKDSYSKLFPLKEDDLDGTKPDYSDYLLRIKGYNDVIISLVADDFIIDKTSNGYFDQNEFELFRKNTNDFFSYLNHFRDLPTWEAFLRNNSFEDFILSIRLYEVNFDFNRLIIWIESLSNLIIKIKENRLSLLKAQFLSFVPNPEAKRFEDSFDKTTFDFFNEIQIARIIGFNCNLNSVKYFEESSRSIIADLFKSRIKNFSLYIDITTHVTGSKLLDFDWSNLLLSFNKGLIKLKPFEEIAIYPPKLVFKVNSQKEVGSNDDLDDEISGYCFYVQKSITKGKQNFQNQPWLSFNDFKIKNPNVSLKSVFEKNYLKAVPNNEESFVKKTHYYISNERPTIFAQSDLDSIDPEIKSKRHDLIYSEINESDSFVLKYGYNYNFLSYAILNSGILPDVLRIDKSILNIPQFENIDLSSESDFFTTYKHLRRVGVKNINFDEKLKENINQIYIGNEVFRFNVNKPKTDFWNWFAGNEIKKDSELFKLAWSHRDKNESNPYISDDAVENEFLVVVEQDYFGTYKFIKSYKSKFVVSNNIVNSVNFSIKLKKKVGDAEPKITINEKSNSIELLEGVKIKISFYPIVKRSYFDDNNPEQIFFSWMKDKIGSGFQDTNVTHSDFLLGDPNSLIVEAAEMTNLSPMELWRYMNLELRDQNIVVSLKKPEGETKEKFIEVFNQLLLCKEVTPYFEKFTWDGRILHNTDIDIISNCKNLDPVYDNFATSNGMLWESWAFSERDDITATKCSTFSLAIEPKVLSDGSVEIPENFYHKLVQIKSQPNRAEYYRFYISIKSRYYDLNAAYQNEIISSLPYDLFDKDNKKRENKKEDSINVGPPLMKWKRIIKPSYRETKLPMPTIRAIIPLTKDLCINPNKKVENENAASVMFICHDAAFMEAGLAEKFEFGINLSEFDGKLYLNAGSDPIKDGRSLLPFDKENEDIEFENDSYKLIINAHSIAALSWQPYASESKFENTCVNLTVNDINKLLKKNDSIDPCLSLCNSLGAESLAKVSIRRNVIKEPENCLHVGDLNIKSEWSAANWIQFQYDNSYFPSFFHGKNNDDEYTFNKSDFKTSKVKFDQYQSFLIISKQVKDINGNYGESYFSVNCVNKDGFECYHGIDIAESKDDLIGYGRILNVLVRDKEITKQKLIDSKIDFWQQLFNITKMGEITNDPNFAKPYISGRFKLKINK